LVNPGTTDYTLATLGHRTDDRWQPEMVSQPDLLGPYGNEVRHGIGVVQV